MVFFVMGCLECAAARRASWSTTTGTAATWATVPEASTWLCTWCLTGKFLQAQCKRYQIVTA